ncbi:MAG: hypothetical protein LBS59_01650 [Puniceicoccales bacterium]|jgi:hypothetical protein|nr:hypothetical protein [Puniceicoccales bacterium]
MRKKTVGEASPSSKSNPSAKTITKTVRKLTEKKNPTTPTKAASPAAEDTSAAEKINPGIAALPPNKASKSGGKSVKTTQPAEPAAATAKPAVAEQTPAKAPAKKSEIIVKNAPPEKKVPLPRVTTIVANIDVGWGNQVFLRGEGGGLSWDYGVPMTCRDNNEWVWVSAVNESSFVFKFVLNDIFWEQSENRSVNGGEVFTTIPLF